MKRTFGLFILSVVFFTTTAQQYDLIVTKEGDSISCQLDSIANGRFYFKMKVKNQFVNTFADAREIKNYEYNAIQASEKQNTNTFVNSLFVGITFVALTLNYEHVFQLAESTKISMRGGIGYDFLNTNTIFMGEVNLIFGKFKNFFEAGIGYQVPQKFPGILIFRPGYRHESKRGVLLKTYPMLFVNLANDHDNIFEDDWKVFVGVGVSIGKSF